MMTFIYGLVDPRNNKLRYVGKSDNPKTRLDKHIREAKLSTILYRHAWIRGLLNKGLAPKLVILMQVPVSSWQEVERLLILSLRDNGYFLTNMAEGGIGGSTGKGRKRSKEFSERLSAINRQRYLDNPELKEQSRKRTREVWKRNGFREKRDAVINSPEVKEKMSKFQKERWSNPDIRRKQAEVGRKNWENPELAEQIKNKITQKWQDPEYRAKQIASRLRRWAIKKGERIDQ